MTPEMQQHRPRNVETPPGPEVGREEEGVHPHASEDTLPCDHSGRAVLGRRNWGHQKTQWLDVGRRPAIRLVKDTLLPLGPQHSWLLVTLLLFLRSREKIPGNFQPVTALMGILLFPFLRSASEELPSSLDSAQRPPPCAGANSSGPGSPNPGDPGD